jgi:hypothetical protein
MQEKDKLRMIEAGFILLVSVGFVQGPYKLSYGSGKAIHPVTIG